MARKAFYSFHYQPDAWRASQVRNMGVVEGNSPVSDNDWEAVKRGGDAAIQKWIDGQLSGRSCAIVLVGADTAGRKWINYEIKAAWDLGKGLVGVRIHGLANQSGYTTASGKNPFDGFTFGADKKQMNSIVKLHSPGGADSKAVYNSIKNNLEGWIEEAIIIRNKY